MTAPDTMNDLTDTAVDWLMRPRPLSVADAQALDAWLDADPEHRRAYGEVEQIWGAAAAVENHPRVETRRRWVLQSTGHRYPRRSIAAALLAGVIGAGAFGYQTMTGPKPLATQAFSTGVGQQATVTLPDGSVVTLNTDTVVRTRADGDRRLVYLDRGQAYFKVAKDARHPFVVTAAGRTVTALGTAFDVRVDGKALKVVLVEGKVRVEAAKAAAAPDETEAPPTQQATEMSAGSELVASNDADWRLARTNVARETSWLNRQIVFDDEPLGEIVEEMNRYTTKKMVIEDPELAQRRLSGIYTAGDLAAFSEALRGYRVAELRETGGQVQVVALK